MTDFSAIGKNKILAIRSADRVTGTPSNFAVNLSAFNIQPTYCSFHQIALPNGFYNINSTSNTFTFQLRSPLFVLYTATATIPVGNYSWNDLMHGTGVGTYTGLIPALEAAAAAVLVGAPESPPSSFFSTTNSFINPDTGFFQLSLLGPPNTLNGWSVRYQGIGSLDFVLGFRFTGFTAFLTPAFGTVTGSAIVDLRSPPSIYIRTSLVSGNYITAKGPESVLVVVQNTAQFLQTIFQRNPVPGFDVFSVSGPVSQVSFQLADEYGHELNMDSGQDWEISIGFYSP